METALITGASSGIGLEMAKELARRKINLVLIARNEVALARIEQDLESTYGVSVDILAVDLSTPQNVQHVSAFVEERGLSITYLINNAGFGDYGRFVERDIDKYTAILRLNIESLVCLTHYFCRHMAARKSGYILNVASIAAYQPNPSFAVYGASKSFVVNFSEALHNELQGTNVSCTVLSPGVTKTNFMAVAEMGSAKILDSGMMSVSNVAVIGIKAMLDRKLYAIPGLKNRILAIISSVTPPSKLRLRIAAKIMEQKKL